MMQNHLEISSTFSFGPEACEIGPKVFPKVDGKFTESPRLVQEVPYGPIRAHMGPYGPHMGPYGFKIGFLMKFLNDSASFLLEKLKNQVILTKNPNI